jgi:phage protein D
MAKLNPDFAITAGNFKAASDSAVGGPVAIFVDRGMDIPADSLELLLMDRGGISAGDDATVELGHDREKEKVFTGSVAEVTPQFGQPTMVRVRAIGTMGKLLNLRKAATYEGQSAGDIVKDLISAAGLDAGTVSDGPTLPRFSIDERASAYAHARGLAARLGYELYTTREGKLMFQPLGSAASLDASAGGGLLGAAASAAVSAASSLLGLGGGAVGYAFGQHLVNVAGTKSTDPLGSVKVGGESPMSSQGDTTAHWLTTNDSDYQGSAGDGEPHRLFLDGAARTKDLADRFAKGRLATAKRASHQVRLTVLGNPGVELGDSISVTDVPDQAATGKGYIRAIRHVLSGRRGFLTTITIAREADA